MRIHSNQGEHRIITHDSGTDHFNEDSMASTSATSLACDENSQNSVLGTGSEECKQTVTPTRVTLSYGFNSFNDIKCGSPEPLRVDPHISFPIYEASKPLFEEASEEELLCTEEIDYDQLLDGVSSDENGSHGNSQSDAYDEILCSDSSFKESKDSNSTSSTPSTVADSDVGVIPSTEREAIEGQRDELRRILSQISRSMSETVTSIPLLPQRDQSDTRITLVLDIDETLIYTSRSQQSADDYSFDYTHGSETAKLYFRVRPYVQEFLQNVAPYFEVVTWTASLKTYADCILDFVDPHGQFIHHRLYRDSCVERKQLYVKDLRCLGRDLSRVIIVDNSLLAFAYQLENGIPIRSWRGEKDDKELQHVYAILCRAITAQDVREVLKEHIKLFEQLKM